MNRFVWQADEFDIDDEVEAEEARTAGLGEGRHSWNSGDHPRDGDGQFAGNGGQYGMPSTLARSTVSLSRGGEARLERHDSGDVSIASGSSTRRLTPQQATSVLDTLSVADDWDPGDDETIPGVGTITRERSGVRLDLDDGPTLDLTSRDVTRMERAREQLDQAERINTGNGDLDIYPDGKKVTFRHLGDDGSPVEVAFNRSSVSKLSATIDRMLDDPDTGAAQSRTVSTNVGKVHVELAGEWGKPGSTLTITPADGNDWGIVVDGPHQQDWGRAVSSILDENAATTLHNIQEHTPLTEAAGGQPLPGRRFRARIIQGDVQGSSGFYPASMLRRDASVFREGLPVFLDHPGVTESYDRPERSVRDLAGRLATAAVYEGDGLYADVEVFAHWAPVIEAMADHIGMSIRASGTVEPSTEESVRGPIVTSLAEATSVDFVTAAGAGGKIVALLESARSEGELLRQAAEALAPPFKKKGAKDDKPANAADKAADDAEDAADGGADEDEEDADGTKKDTFPAFLKKKTKAKEKVSEARNVGHWMESRLHRAFTEMADDMFGEGRLSRDERIGLSSAIGEGLNAFNAKIADQLPHLYERDLWDEPGPATPEDSAPAEAAAKKEPGSSPADTKDKEGEMPEFTEAQARELEEARTTAETGKAQALAEAETAKQAAAAAELKLARFAALETARPIATGVLAESGLPAAAQGKLLAALTSESVPLTTDNALDEAALKTSVEEAVKAESTYLASLAEGDGAGRPRGLGESTTAPSVSDPATVTALEETYRSRGLSPEAARFAAVGRP